MNRLIINFSDADQTKKNSLGKSALKFGLDAAKLYGIAVGAKYGAGKLMKKGFFKPGSLTGYSIAKTKKNEIKKKLYNDVLDAKVKRMSKEHIANLKSAAKKKIKVINSKTPFKTKAADMSKSATKFMTYDLMTYADTPLSAVTWTAVDRGLDKLTEGKKK